MTYLVWEGSTMNISLRYFLVVAEEMSISRAAEKLFVTQQCISSHIKKLEQLYQAELFIRRPTFQLTPEGQALQRNLLRQRILEDALSDELEELKAQRINRIRLGIHNTRASILLPAVIRDFRREFPNVLIEIYQGNTSTFETLLLDGKLDIFLATDTAELPEFRCTFLQREPIFLVSSASFLKDHGMESTITSHTISPSLISRFSFISSPENSYLQSKIDNWLLKQKISIQKQIVVGTYQIQLMLAAQNVGACFCPQMFLKMVHELNQNISENDRLVPLLVDGFDLSTELSIITHRDAYQSIVLQRFSEIFQQAISLSLSKNVQQSM